MQTSGGAPGGGLMRFAVDTGGTFTDLIVEDDAGGLHMYKASTTPSDPIDGVIDSLKRAAEDFGIRLDALVGPGGRFLNGTAHAAEWESHCDGTMRIEQ